MITTPVEPAIVALSRRVALFFWIFPRMRCVAKSSLIIDGGKPRDGARRTIAPAPQLGLSPEPAPLREHAERRALSACVAMPMIFSRASRAGDFGAALRASASL